MLVFFIYLFYNWDMQFLNVVAHIPYSFRCTININLHIPAHSDFFTADAQFRISEGVPCRDRNLLGPAVQ